MALHVKQLAGTLLCRPRVGFIPPEGLPVEDWLKRPAKTQCTKCKQLMGLLPRRLPGKKGTPLCPSDQELDIIAAAAVD